MPVAKLLRPAVYAALLVAGLCALALFGMPLSRADDTDKRIEAAEARRIAVIDKIKPSVVAIFAPGGQGGGSGVVISRDGYALTNFHVVQGSGPVMQCGLPDGVLYDSVLVGLDPVGDVALIKLLPKKPGQDFPAAPLGNSDKVNPGDWSLAMGNPFLLATDFTPTVTYGLVSGVHRYQYPEGSKGLLEYTDCIQTDTSINPGNSGGPLFNMDGELIGINGRISLEKRGRINSGVGYAISINQIKNFMGHLRAGLQADHASLGAIIENRTDEGQTGMIVTSILENCDARRRGLDLNDELVSFAGRPIGSRNHFQNVMGLFPKGWRVPLVYRRNSVKQEILVRLMGTQRGEIDDDGKPKPPQPGPQPRPAPPVPNSPAAKLYKAKPGFANFYFNEQETNRLWRDFVKHGDFASLAGTWTIDADLQRKGTVAGSRISISEERDASGKINKTLAKLFVGNIGFVLEPLKPDLSPDELKQPTDVGGSGGLLMALYQYRRLLTAGPKGFEQGFNHGGFEPYYPMPLDGSKPKNYSDLRVDTEVLRTEHAAVTGKWFFSQKDQRLLGAEITVIRDEDPCELYFSDYKKVDGRELPHRIEVRYGNGSYGVFAIKSYQLAAGK
ncbi:MAG TPA: trypsin-like peptidase domain-containing protein [Gemmataceae bacterium]|jgi:serine protease Do|nr:trypsin-like peptidase domain-containing protein [Gemmataceae bacterium]